MACMFGARLAAVAEVTLLGTWAEGLEAIRNRGIRVEAASESKDVRVKAFHLDSGILAADLVLILVKAWQTSDIARCLPSLLKAEGIAVTLQNGLGNRELLGASVCPGVTTQGATLLGPGQIRVGGEGPTHMVAPAWVVDLFRAAGFEAYGCGAAQVDSLIWGKLTANCGINPLTALLRVPNGALLELPDALGILDAAARECAGVARARGITLLFGDPAAHARDVARKTADNRSSMLQDMERGPRTEVDAINGALVREGLRLDVATPVNETLWRLIRAASKSPEKIQNIIGALR
jgi:2-dehydropantoate 2-reductase